MATIDLTNFWINQKFTDGQKILASDLDNASIVGQSNLLHALSALIATDSGLLGSCVIAGLAPSLSGADVAITAGVGLSYDSAANTADFDYETAKFVVVPTNITDAIPAEPGSFPRVDVIYLIPNEVEDTNDSRVVVDTTGPTFTPTNIDLRRSASYTVEWETGTDGSYTVPAIPATGIALANVFRVSSGVNLVYDRRLPANLDNRVLPFPGEAITRPFVVSGGVASSIGGLSILVTEAVACVGTARRRVIAPRAVVTASSDASQARWTYITVSTDGVITATAASPGAAYAAPSASDCRVAAVYVPAAGTTPGDIIDERNVQAWARGTAFGRGQRVPVANLPAVHWYVDPAAVTSDGNDGFFFSGDLQWANGEEYVPATDGDLTVRAELWLRQDAKTENDGSANYTAYHWVPVIEAMPLGDAMGRTYTVTGDSLITNDPSDTVYPSALSAAMGVDGSGATAVLFHTLNVPVGATIDSVVVHFARATTLQGDITATLHEVTPTSGALATLATIGDLGGASTAATLTLTPAAVVGPERGYRLALSLVGGAGGGDTVTVKTVRVNYSLPTGPAFTLGLGTDTSAILSAYQGGQAVWTDSESTARLCVHVRGTSKDVTDYDRIRLVLTVDRVATDIDDGSALSADELTARTQAERTRIIVTPPSITTTTQVEEAL